MNEAPEPKAVDAQAIERETMEFDVVIVGASDTISKVYYPPGEFDEDSAGAPICASIRGDVPDPGVPDSYSHPFRVVRFTNASKGLLERGPIAVFEKGSFLDKTTGFREVGDGLMVVDWLMEAGSDEAWSDQVIAPDGKRIYVITAMVGRTVTATGEPTAALAHPGSLLEFTYTRHR